MLLPFLAIQMALGARERLLGGFDDEHAVAVSATGVAGPGGSESKPAGTVWIGIAGRGEADARLFRLDGPESAQPGPEPPPDAVKVAEFRFRSEVVDAPPAISADGTELRPTKDALFSLVPANKSEEPAADAFAAMRLPAEATFEIDLEFDARPDLPASNRIEIAYSKPMRSLLRGTFLESASESLLGSTRPSSK